MYYIGLMIYLTKAFLIYSTKRYFETTYVIWSYNI